MNTRSRELKGTQTMTKTINFVASTCRNVRQDLDLIQEAYMAIANDDEMTWEDELRYRKIIALDNSWCDMVEFYRDHSKDQYGKDFDGIAFLAATSYIGSKVIV